MIETARGTVHEWQRDHMGHINVRAYLEFFDHAAWQTYAALGLTASLLRSGEANLAAVQQNVSYKRELYPGDTIAVRTGVLELREKVVRFRHELYNTETNEGVDLRIHHRLPRCEDAQVLPVSAHHRQRRGRADAAGQIRQEVES